MKTMLIVITLVLSQFATADVYPRNPSYGKVCAEFAPYVYSPYSSPICIRYEEQSISGEYCSERSVSGGTYGECLDYKNTNPNNENQTGG